MSERSGGKGLDLEECLRSYFWRAGCYTVRGVKFFVNDDEVSDVDLWIYERPSLHIRRRTLLDAKNKKSPKAAERVVWARGLKEALGVDSAIVATTDRRPGIRTFAKENGVFLLDGEAISKIIEGERAFVDGQLSNEQIEQLLRIVDEERRTTAWRKHYREAKDSILTGFGVHSANRSLAACAFFAEQCVLSQPSSSHAREALRNVYLTASLAAVSLDYILADYVFTPPSTKYRSIISAIRFGESENSGIPRVVSAALSLTRRYLDNGDASAKQLELGFLADADRVPAEIIADYLVRASRADTIFNAARGLENASRQLELPAFDQLGTEARSLLAVFLDFNGVAREKVALSWSPTARGKVN